MGDIINSGGGRNHGVVMEIFIKGGVTGFLHEKKGL